RPLGSVRTRDSWYGSFCLFFFASRRRHTRCLSDWSSDVCSSDLYLDTLGPAYDHSKTVVIGRENPWLRERGHGISYINHTLRQIAMPSQNVTEYGGNESFVNRREFAESATEVIENRAGQWIQSNGVTKIKK